MSKELSKEGEILSAMFDEDLTIIKQALDCMLEADQETEKLHGEGFLGKHTEAMRDIRRKMDRWSPTKRQTDYCRSICEQHADQFLTQLVAVIEAQTPEGKAAASMAETVVAARQIPEYDQNPLYGAF